MIGRGHATPIRIDGARTQPFEIQSLNQDLIRFDLGSVEIEELERRFELAVLGLAPAICSGCPHLMKCGTFCAPPPV